MEYVHITIRDVYSGPIVDLPTELVFSILDRGVLGTTRIPDAWSPDPRADLEERCHTCGALVFDNIPCRNLR